MTVSYIFSTKTEMNLLLRIFIILIARNFPLVQCDELVGVLVPKVAYKNKLFSTKVQVYDLEDYKTEVGLQFMKVNVTYQLMDDGNKTLKFRINNFGMRNSTDLTMTLLREKKVRGKFINQCNTQTKEIKIDHDRFYIFIQLDKPVYKPDDDVRFRIIVIDKDLNPFQMRNIKVNILDPYGRQMEEYIDLEGRHIGVFGDKYSLSNSTLLGDWTITAVVDKNFKYAVSKIFPVQKYALPLFQVKFETSSKIYLPNSKLVFSFSARYSFGHFVNGDAVLVIKDAYDNRTCLTKTYKNIAEVKTVMLNIRHDLNIEITNRMNFIATLTFTEPETGIKVSKSATFSISDTQSVSIKPVHSKTYTPGLPFNMKIFASSWDDKKLTTNEPVDIDYVFKHKSGKVTRAHYMVHVKDSVANQEIIVPEDVVNFEIECKLVGSKIYRTRVLREKTIHAKNTLKLDYRFQKDNITDADIVNIFVNSAFRMEKILVAVMTKFGAFQTETIKCNDKSVFDFPIEIKPQMMPHFTVEVYHVRDKDVVEHGNIKIETKDMGDNFLDVKLSTDNAKVRSKIKMTFNTNDDSKIYMLAIDKRLRFLRDGNDLTKKEVVNELSTYESQTEVILDDLTTWHECTEEEVNRVVSGRFDGDPHSSDTFLGNDDDELLDEDEIEDEDVSDEEVPTTQQDPSEEDLLREYFPEVWLFDEIEAEEYPLTKEFMVPDTITSWHISAFSMHPTGLAVMDPQELLVKKDFFIQFSLPYSIRYKEVLKVDVLVFNYVPNNKDLDVKLKILNQNSNQFEFVNFEKAKKGCKPTYSNVPSITQSIKVPALGMKKSSFYIRSNSLDENDKSNAIKAKRVAIQAEGTDDAGNKYKDGIKKILRVEAVGVRKFNTEAHTFLVKGYKNESSSELNYDGPSNTYCVISGDYMTDAVTLNSAFENYPTACLEQKTSRLKGNVQVYRYFNTKNKPQKKEYFKKQYQAVWSARGQRYNYEASTGYIAYFIDAVVPAMKLDLITHDKPIIEKEMEKLKDAQTDSGNFTNFGKFPSFTDKESKRQSTATYFQTAFILISLLKAQEFVDKDYSDVINKAFSFLDSKTNRNPIDYEGVSIGAYAYALGMKHDSSREEVAIEFLRQLENAKVDHGDSKKCYKIKINSKACDMRHTAYAAMAYLKLDDVKSAMPLIYWLLKEFNFYSLSGYTYNTAILSEPIAEAAVALGVKSTDFEVTLNDRHRLNKSFKYTNANKNDRHEVKFIPNTKYIDMTVEGTGYCSITRIDETVVTEHILSPSFTVDIDSNIESTRSNERIVKICAMYNSTGLTETSIVNVIYEVEFPTGYVYAGILNEKKQQEFIKQIEERKGKSLVYIYYNDFNENVNYCVEVKAAKVFNVQNPFDAGVKVYDYIQKHNVAVEFYNFDSSTLC